MKNEGGKKEGASLASREKKGCTQCSEETHTKQEIIITYNTEKSGEKLLMNFRRCLSLDETLAPLFSLRFSENPSFLTLTCY